MECDSCAHLFYSPPNSQSFVDDHFGDEYFNGGGGGYSDYTSHSQLLIEQGQKYGRILKRHHDVGDLLDIGAAAGFLLKGMCNAGWFGQGIEPNETMVNHGTRELQVDLKHGVFEELEYARDLFDAVSLIQVISHLRDPMRCLKQINHVVKDDGLLLIETWDRNSLTAKAFGRNWHQYNPPSVLHWFSKPELKKLLAEAGFEVIEWGRPTKWISIGNGFSLLRHSMKESLLGRIATSPLAMVPKSLKVPYFLNDVFWVVARKKRQSN